MLLQALEPPYNRPLPLLKHRTRQVRAAVVQRDGGALGEGSDVVLVELLKALKSSSLNGGREQPIFLKLGLHREPHSPMTSSNAVPAEAARPRLKPPVCRKPQPVWVLQGLGRGAEMKYALLLRSLVLSFLCLPSLISLKIRFLCFPLSLRLVLCLCRRLCERCGDSRPRLPPAQPQPSATLGAGGLGMRECWGCWGCWARWGYWGAGSVGGDGDCCIPISWLPVIKRSLMWQKLSA